MAKKGLGKGLGAIFGEDVVKESKEELEKAKAKRAAAACLLYTSPSPRDGLLSRMPSSA